MKITQALLKRVYKNIKGSNRFISEYRNDVKTTIREYKKDIIEVIIEDNEDKLISRYNKDGIAIATTVLNKKSEKENK